MPIVEQDIASGRPPTVALFYEMFSSADTKPIFTLKKKDHNGFLSLHKLYLELTEEDPSEVAFAEHVFGHWQYWQDVANTNKLKPYIEEMRKEASMIRKRRVLEGIAKKIKLGTANLGETKLYFEYMDSSEKPTKPTKQKNPNTIISDEVNRDFERLKIV